MNSTLEIVTDARPAGTPAVRSGTLLGCGRRFTGTWDTIFANAHRYSGPGNASLVISNRNPDPNAEGSRNVFKDDEVEIMAAAKKHGYVRQDVGHKNPRAVSFVNVNVRGEQPNAPLQPQTPRPKP